MSSTQEMNVDEQWAAVEFADIELNDARLNRRCQELAIALGQQPKAPINQQAEIPPRSIFEVKDSKQTSACSPDVNPVGI